MRCSRFPLRSALRSIAIALLGAVWFVALRPKPDTSADAPLPTAPGVAGPEQGRREGQRGHRDREQGRCDRAGDRAPSAGRRDEGRRKTTVTKTPTATKVTKTTATKVDARQAPPSPPRRSTRRLRCSRHSIAARSSSCSSATRSSDSDSVATLVRGIGKRKKVVARVVSIKDVGKYQTFTADTPIQQAPTTLVIGPKRRAKVIVGFTSIGELARPSPTCRAQQRLAIRTSWQRAASNCGRRRKRAARSHRDVTVTVVDGRLGPWLGVWTLRRSC